VSLTSPGNPAETGSSLYRATIPTLATPGLVLRSSRTSASTSLRRERTSSSYVSFRILASVGLIVFFLSLRHPEQSNHELYEMVPERAASCLGNRGLLIKVGTRILGSRLPCGRDTQGRGTEQRRMGRRKPLARNLGPLWSYRCRMGSKRQVSGYQCVRVATPGQHICLCIMKCD
jgi:hypothetical protein